MGAILKVNHRVALLVLHPKENKEGDNIVSGLLKCPTPWVLVSEMTEMATIIDLLSQEMCRIRFIALYRVPSILAFVFL